MRIMRAVGVAAGVALAGVGGGAAAIDLDDPAARPLHYAMETLSTEAVTVAGLGAERATYYNVEAPPHEAELTTTSKFPLLGSENRYLRADLDGMVFSATPQLTTRGEGSGSGFASTAADALAGGAGESFVIYRLPVGDFARDLTFALSIGDTLAVPAGEGRYGAKMALYRSSSDALDAANALSYRVFGGEATVVVVGSGIAVDIESCSAVADVEEDFRAFVAESASGASTAADNPSAPAVLGSIAVRARGPDADGRGPTVYAARGRRPVTAADVIGTVSARIKGDMTFGTLDLRTGTAADRCLATSAAGGGVLALAPPSGEAAVTTVGTATLEHGEEPWNTRHLCVWLAEPEAGTVPARIPIVLYEATVRVTPPRGETVVRSGNVGVIGRSGARVDIVHLTGVAGYDETLVMVNRGATGARYLFDAFVPAPGVSVELTPAAAAAEESGLNVIEPGAMVALSVAETLLIEGGDAPTTAATLSFQAHARHIDVAVVRTNRSDGSTDTVVHPAAQAGDAATNPNRCSCDNSCDTPAAQCPGDAYGSHPNCACPTGKVYDEDANVCTTVDRTSCGRDEIGTPPVCTSCGPGEVPNAMGDACESCPPGQTEATVGQCEAGGTVGGAGHCTAVGGHQPGDEVVCRQFGNVITNNACEVSSCPANSTENGSGVCVCNPGYVYDNSQPGLHGAPYSFPRTCTARTAALCGTVADPGTCGPGGIWNSGAAVCDCDNGYDRAADGQSCLVRVRLHGKHGQSGERPAPQLAVPVRRPAGRIRQRHDGQPDLPAPRHRRARRARWCPPACTTRASAPMRTSAPAGGCRSQRNSKSTVVS